MKIFSANVLLSIVLAVIGFQVTQVTGTCVATGQPCTIANPGGCCSKKCGPVKDEYLCG